METIRFKEYEAVRLREKHLALEEIKRQVMTICDEVLGNGLYTEERLRAISMKNNHYFYYVMKNQSVVGVFYCYADLFRNTDLFHQVNDPLLSADTRVGIGQSIALKHEVRKQGLSEWLLEHGTRQLFEKQQVEAILVPAYVKDGITPAKAHLEKCGYRMLHMLDHPWADCETLVCQLCGTSPCSCDGAAYIRRKGTNNEQ